MKRLFLSSVGLAVLVGMSLPLWAQHNSRGKSEVTLKGQAVSVEYGRPSLHGRTVTEMLAKLEPGQFWRLGADQSTTFTTETALAFGKAKIPAGTYSLWAERASGNSWKLVFNKQHGQWGTEHNAKLDFASVPLKEEKAADSADLLTIDLKRMGSGAEFSVHWGDLKLVTNFRAQ